MSLQTGDTIFYNWKIKKVIGNGTFGRVYEIEREEFGHIYYAAAKVISIPGKEIDVGDYYLADGLSEENVAEYYYSFVEDIVNECMLMERMKGDSHIVSYEDHVVEKGEDGKSWEIYIRMELLTPLMVHIKKKSFFPEEVVQLGIDICSALETCQKFNVIHRDIKPENIFISEQTGNYKLGDFGISRALEQNEMAVSKKGTQMYMAPEVYRGEGYASTVDIYSLGLVLFRLLNDNRVPFLPLYPEKISFRDQDRAVMRRLSGDKIPKPRYASGKLGEIIQKACSYQPQDRYSSPAEMKKELKAILYEMEEEKRINCDKEERMEQCGIFSQADTDDMDKTMAVFHGGRYGGKESVQGKEQPVGEKTAEKEKELLSEKAEKEEIDRERGSERKERASDIFFEKESVKREQKETVQEEFKDFKKGNDCEKKKQEYFQLKARQEAKDRMVWENWQKEKDKDEEIKTNVCRILIILGILFIGFLLLSTYNYHKNNQRQVMRTIDQNVMTEIMTEESSKQKSEIKKEYDMLTL